MMSTPAYSNPPMGSDRAGRGRAPSRTDGRETHAGEWAELDAEAVQAGLEERVWPELEYERYDGPLDWNAWQQERRRSQQLHEWGVQRPKLPREYAAALGSSRVDDIERRAEDLAARHAASPPNTSEERARLSHTAKALAPALRKLDLDVGARVVRLEAVREDLREQWIDATRKLSDYSNAVGYSEPSANESIRLDELRGELEVPGHGLEVIKDELDALAEHRGHPDRWVERHGQTVAEALGATEHFRREERERAVGPPGHGAELRESRKQEPEVYRPGAVPDAPAAGLEPF